LNLSQRKEELEGEGREGRGGEEKRRLKERRGREGPGQGSDIIGIRPLNLNGVVIVRGVDLIFLLAVPVEVVVAQGRKCEGDRQEIDLINQHYEDGRQKDDAIFIH
jgi:hypothetical protein